MGCRSPVRPRKVARTLHCAPAVSCAGSPRKGYAPLHDYVVVVVSVVVVCWDWFRLTSRGVLPRTPFTYYVVCVSLSMCGVASYALRLVSRRGVFGFSGWCVVGVATYARLECRWGGVFLVTV